MHAVHYTATVIYSAHTHHGDLQQFRFTVRLLRLLNTIYPVLPCPMKHVTTDRHRRGIIRVGPLEKYILRLEPLAVTKRIMIVTTDAMSGMIMHREDRIRPGGHHPRHRLLQGTASANNAAGSGADTGAATEKDAIIRRFGNSIAC